MLLLFVHADNMLYEKIQMDWKQPLAFNILKNEQFYGKLKVAKRIK